MMNKGSAGLLIVGFGVRGRQWASVVGSSSIFTLMGVIDPRAEARAAAKDWGVPAYASLEEAASGTEVSAVLIASTPQSHATDAMGALSRGMAALVEKPLALSTEEGLQVALESRHSRLPVMVVQNFRYRPREVIAFDLLRREVVGVPDLSVITSSRTRAAASPHVGELEMGALWDFSIHHLDILRIRFGMPSEVRASVERVARGRALLNISLGWEGGLRVTYHHSEDAPLYRYQEWIEGPKGSIFLDHQKVWFVPKGRRPRRVRRPKGGLPETHILERFFEALEGADPGDLGVADNVSTLAVAEAVTRSVKEGAPIDPSDILGSIVRSQTDE